MRSRLGIYKKISIHSSSKEKLLLMLYQAAILNCKKAITAIEDGDIAKKGEFIGKLQDIINELSNSLDFNVGGDVALELDSLYDFIIFATTQANINSDKSQLVGCLEILTTLYDAWMKAVERLKKSA